MKDGDPQIRIAWLFPDHLQTVLVQKGNGVNHMANAPASVAA